MKPEMATNSSAVTVSRILPEDHFLKRIADVHELISRRAYQIFAAHGCIHGHDVENWLQAESELVEPIAVQISETDDGLIVRAFVPEYRVQDIEVHVDARRLFLTGRREGSSWVSEGKIVKMQRRSNWFFRGIELPAQIDPESTRAMLSNGELEIELPKVETGRKAGLPLRAAA